MFYISLLEKILPIVAISYVVILLICASSPDPTLVKSMLRGTRNLLYDIAPEAKSFGLLWLQYEWVFLKRVVHYLPRLVNCIDDHFFTYKLGYFVALAFSMGVLITLLLIPGELFKMCKAVLSDVKEILSPWNLVGYVVLFAIVKEISQRN
jgi:hypothetical protein